ncbi:helix-turn-helix transcriptional regulator [Cellulomonas sp.]|uniref:helix-turn-helix transcriptional regulator n=1 Tax=Cellulomonas sp. TaxID=40001 RepID=UPI001B058261|nr:helix-turn-helix transcriptional regulator [Cellulomonas sp.]MBO9556576.1 helix-turn-helix domain-containing protein [Cellulomonas sp.]
MDRAELAHVLRRARGRLTPQDVGLAAGERRRVAGLRREEVALLAGVSVDYVVRLEQGRGPQPSAQVLRSLARALRLDDDERAELFHLAGSAPPLPGTVDDVVRPSVQRLMDRLVDLPVMLLSARGDVLAWNAMASALLGDWSSVPERERNINRIRFLGTTRYGTRSRVAMTPEERDETAVAAVAALRAATARYPKDAGLAALVEELREKSEQFERLWQAGGASSWRSQRKTIEHPTIGAITLDCDSLHVPDSDQALVVYSAPAGSPEAEALALLRVIGTQSLTPAEASGSSAGAPSGVSPGLGRLA